MTSSSSSPAERLLLDSEARAALLDHAREGAAGTPAEVCGVLVGSRDDPERVTEIRRVANVAGDPRRAYELDPAETMATIEAVEDDGDDVVGFYHSHPEGTARPSAVDRDRATWTGYVYLVVGLGPAQPEVRAWRWTGEAFDPLSVAVDD